MGALKAALAVLGGRWPGFIVNQLLGGVCRFGQLKQAIPTITQKMLAQHLRELEEAGVVTRRVYPEVPPRVEYRLTAHGETLEPVLRILTEWGDLHRQHRALTSSPTIEPPSLHQPTPADEARPVVTVRERLDTLSHEALTEAVRAAAMG